MLSARASGTEFRAGLLALLALTACSAIGDPGGYPDAYPHGGTGVFRQLTADEVGVFDGRVLALQNAAVEGAMVARGHLFYTAAPRLAEPPEVPMEHPRSEVFWAAFEPRSIFRAAPREDLGFRPGDRVLSASAAWEGGEVFDPWVVTDGEGTVRLYYAAGGGIGLAEAPSIEGPYTRVGDGPILDAGAALRGTPRRPSVVRGPDGALFMYYDAGGAIGIARSQDGRSFARIDGDPSTPAVDPIVITGEDLGESPEREVGHPGAAALDTAAGRRLVRLYYESRREDGSTRAYVAGSADGVSFERHELAVMESSDVRFPAPVLLDDRVTLLYANAPFSSGGYQTRGLVGAVSPAAVSFAPPED